MVPLKTLTLFRFLEMEHVKFDRIAPIYLSGLSIASAKTRLKNRLSKLYAGLVSSMN